MRARAQSSLAALDPASSRAIIPMTRQGTVVEIDGAVGARLGDRDGEIRDAHLACVLSPLPPKFSGCELADGRRFCRPGVVSNQGDLYHALYLPQTLVVCSSRRVRAKNNPEFPSGTKTLASLEQQGFSLHAGLARANPLRHSLIVPLDTTIHR